MCVTIAGKIGACASGAAIVPPRLTEAITPSIDSSTATLPPVRPVISSACSSGTPAAVSDASVRDQRATAICCTIVPIFIGTCRRKWSHCRRPQEVFFHFTKTTMASAVPPDYQPPVAEDDMGERDRHLGHGGSEPPNSLKTPSNTGTRKATSAIMMPIAKKTTSAG